MKIDKYYYHIEAGSKREGWDDRLRNGINLHIKAKSEKEAIKIAKRLYKRRYYEIYRIDKEIS